MPGNGICQQISYLKHNSPFFLQLAVFPNLLTYGRTDGPPKVKTTFNILPIFLVYLLLIGLQSSRPLELYSTVYYSCKVRSRYVVRCHAASCRTVSCRTVSPSVPGWTYAQILNFGHERVSYFYEPRAYTFALIECCAINIIRSSSSAIYSMIILFFQIQLHGCSR